MNRVNITFMFSFFVYLFLKIFFLQFYDIKYSNQMQTYMYYSKFFDLKLKILSFLVFISIL